MDLAVCRFDSRAMAWASHSWHTVPVQSHPTITKAKNWEFFVRYSEILEEIPYSEGHLYGSRGV